MERETGKERREGERKRDRESMRDKWSCRGFRFWSDGVSTVVSGILIGGAGGWRPTRRMKNVGFLLCCTEKR